jgi:hypothetical protein
MEESAKTTEIKAVPVIQPAARSVTEKASSNWPRLYSDSALIASGNMDIVKRRTLSALPPHISSETLLTITTP